jgi:hypothetical protein
MDGWMGGHLLLSTNHSDKALGQLCVGTLLTGTTLLLWAASKRIITFFVLIFRGWIFIFIFIFIFYFKNNNLSLFFPCNLRDLKRTKKKLTTTSSQVG